MKSFLPIILVIVLSACGETAPKTGAMPGIANGGYDAPSNAEAAAAYMAGFQARYDIPELEYPEDIKARVRAARQAKMQTDMQVMEKRQEIIATLALTVLAQKDPEAKKLLKDLKDNPKAQPDTGSMDQMFAMIESQPKRHRLSETERQTIYHQAVRDYKSDFKSLTVNTCRWTEMKRLIGSRHEEMAFIHGSHPTHGYMCAVDLQIEKRKGYPRTSSFNDFWVKTHSGEWNYYGKYRNVGIGPRLQKLNPDILRDPEGTIMRQSIFGSVASSFN